MTTLEQAHAYWRSPGDDNQPAGYMDGAERTAFLVDLVSRHVPKDAPILELGCNVGRNLAGLDTAGHDHLVGVEINPEAVSLGRYAYPALRDRTILPIPIEWAVKQFADDTFDLVFTMAVLEHLHPDSEYVFAEMARISRRVITIEDEHGVSPRHWPRDYGTVFGLLGMVEIETVSCADVPGLGPDFMARVFVK